jgi:hypothetical protein
MLIFGGIIHRLFQIVKILELILLVLWWVIQLLLPLIMMDR